MLQTITVELYSDAVTDDNEGFYLELYKSEQDMTNGTVHKEAKALINDVTAVDNYTYTVAANSNSSSSPAEEGQNIAFPLLGVEVLVRQRFIKYNTRIC